MKVLICIVLLCTSLPLRAETQAPMQVTSDTPVYCLSLAQRMETAAPMPARIRVLWEQGRDLCTHGQVRIGLLRLRRAMRMARDATQ